MNDPLKRLEMTGFFPIVEVRNAEKIRALAATLVASGLPVIEIPLRTDAALDAMRIVRDEFPDVLLGAGTVLSPRSADMAFEAGARFMLAPGFNPRVVDHCLEKGYVFIPGISSPTGIELAIEKGLRAVKFFPAAELGGLRFLKAMAAPFTGIKYVPTGGVSNENIAEYLRDDRVLACGGTWVAKSDLVEAGRTKEIARVVDGAYRAVLDLRLEHVPDAEAGKAISALFPGGDDISSVRVPDDGRHADNTVVISTTDRARAAAYFERKGFVVLRADTGPIADEAVLEHKGIGLTIRVIERSVAK